MVAVLGGCGGRACQDGTVNAVDGKALVDRRPGPDEAPP
jgi:hypothetical protein